MFRSRCWCTGGVQSLKSKGAKRVFWVLLFRSFIDNTVRKFNFFFVKIVYSWKIQKTA